MTNVRFDLPELEEQLVSSVRLKAYRADEHSFLTKHFAYGAGLDGVTYGGPSSMTLLTHT